MTDDLVTRLRFPVWTDLMQEAADRITDLEDDNDILNSEVQASRVRITELEAEVERLTDENVKFRQHSVELNRVGWRLSELLNEVGPDDTEYWTDVDVKARLDMYAEWMEAESRRLTAVTKKAARDLYHAEVRRQGIGWDDFCTELLIRSQHLLANALSPKEQRNG